MYKCKHFKLDELVPPEILDQVKDKPWKGWCMFDDRALITLDKLQEKYGTTTVNNYKWGGNRKYSGFRPHNCVICDKCSNCWAYNVQFNDNCPKCDSYEFKPLGSKFSQHKFGRGFDLIFKHESAEKVREYVLSHSDEFPFITAIELGVSWFHFDTRNMDREDGIFTFRKY